MKPEMTARHNARKRIHEMKFYRTEGKRGGKVVPKIQTIHTKASVLHLPTHLNL